MISDEVLLERLRGAMAAEVSSLEAPPELLGRLPAPRRRAGLASLAPAVSIALATVVVVAVVVLGGQRGSRAVVPAGARSLVSQLAVLRRAQTAADRLPARVARGALSFPAHGRLVGGLSRLANGYAGTNVYLVVETPMRATRARHAVPCCLVNAHLGDLVDTSLSTAAGSPPPETGPSRRLL